MACQAKSKIVRLEVPMRRNNEGEEVEETGKQASIEKHRINVISFDHVLEALFLFTLILLGECLPLLRGSREAGHQLYLFAPLRPIGNNSRPTPNTDLCYPYNVSFTHHNYHPICNVSAEAT